MPDGGGGGADAHGTEAVGEKRERNHVGKTPRQVNWYDRSYRESHNFGGGLKWCKWCKCVCIIGGQNNLQAPLALFSKPRGPQTCTIVQ